MVKLYKKELQNAMNGNNGMMEGFKAIEIALTDVGSVAKHK
jgi:hypothetical protein